MADTVRLDKWLWAARFYKTRPLAQKAIEGGKVRVDGARSKAGKSLQLGQEMEVRVGMEIYQITVVKLSDKRGPASVARTLYEESAASIRARERASEERRIAAKSEPRLAVGRPDKYQRRQIQKLKEKNR
ncbi:S4 domain-containing protein [Kiritimatiellota bacterium B12222]|nr:S4 domain-containing protein [Kiritimatiellota bacterium B12222]